MATYHQRLWDDVLNHCYRLSKPGLLDCSGETSICLWRSSQKFRNFRNLRDNSVLLVLDNPTIVSEGTNSQASILGSPSLEKNVPVGPDELHQSCRRLGTECRNLTELVESAPTSRSRRRILFYNKGDCKPRQTRGTVTTGVGQELILPIRRRVNAVTAMEVSRSTTLLMIARENDVRRFDVTSICCWLQVYHVDVRIGRRFL